jgi:cytochrome P450
MMVASDVELVPDHVPGDLVYPFSQVTAEGFVTDPYGAYGRVQHEAPRIFFSPTAFPGGAWCITRYEDVRTVLQDSSRFTTTMGYAPDVDWPRRIIPLELDPPDHHKYRVLLSPLFAPAAVDELETTIRRTANELIDEVIDSGQCDFVPSFARMLPGTVFLKLLGLPVEERDRFFEWEDIFFHSGTVEQRRQVGVEIADRLNELIGFRRRQPGDDVVSELIKATVDGKPIEDEYIQDMCFLLFIAGLDTVTAGLGHSFRWLAEHPDRRRALVADPALIPNAVEELLRWHAWVNPPRNVRVDSELAGVKMKKGDQIMMLLTLADRDNDTFADADVVDFERSNNAHFAFGGGVHRCVGSHLARRELSVAIEQWLGRIPDFTVATAGPLPYNPYGMFSLQTLPLAWPRYSAAD